MKSALFVVTLLPLALAAGCRDFSTLPGGWEPPKLPVSVQCNADDECQSGACVDALCCERKCSPDEVCNLEGRPGRCSPRPTGTACTTAAQCPGGLCVHGLEASVCCDRECAPTERCDLAGHLGTCTARPLGDGCIAAGQCASGHCVDGVCCDGACDGLCHTCSAGPMPGVCALAAENTDQRRECGVCGACIDGACGPAEAGTDPAGSCTGGRTCSPGQECRLPLGEPCAANEDCAVGTCVLGQCLAWASERAFAEPMSDAPRQTKINALMPAAPGEFAVSLGEVLGNATSLWEMQVHALVRKGGQWRVAGTTSVPDHTTGTPISDITFWNRRLYESVSLGQCGTSSCGPKGLFGRLYSSGLVPGDYEPIGAADAKPTSTRLLLDSQRQLLDLPREGAAAHLYRREAAAGQPPAWVEKAASLPSSGAWTATVYAGNPVVAEYGPGKLVVRDLLTGTVLGQAVPTTAGECDPPAIYAGSFGSGAEEGLLVTGTCYNQSLLATWRPSAPEAERFTFSVSTFLDARPVAGARVPCAVALKFARKMSAGYDAFLLWQEKAEWKSLMAHSSVGLVVHRALGRADETGLPVLGLDLAQTVTGSDGMVTFADQEARVVWLHR